MSVTNTLRAHRTPFAATIIASLALAFTACTPVAPLGSGPLANPQGVLDSVVAGNGSITIRGWAANGPVGPNAQPAGPTNIVVMVNGDWVAQAFQTDQARPDVDQAILNVVTSTGNVGLLQFRQPGNAYGFDFAVTAAPGAASVCVVALNSDYGNFGGDHVLLGCRDVTVT